MAIRVSTASLTDLRDMLPKEYINIREDATFNNMEFNVSELKTILNFDADAKLTLLSWGKIINDWAERKGWNKHIDIPSQFENFHAEISEAWEEYRRSRTMMEVYYNWDLCECGLLSHEHVHTLELHTPGCPATKPEGIPIELADLVIRVLHTCGFYGIDLEAMMKLKMKYNETREYRHGGKIA